LSRLPGKRARPVLRGPRCSNAPGLPDELFSILARWLLKRAADEFCSREELVAKIMAFIAEYDRTATPFRWTYDGSPLKVA